MPSLMRKSRKQFHRWIPSEAAGLPQRIRSSIRVLEVPIVTTQSGHRNVFPTPIILIGKICFHDEAVTKTTFTDEQVVKC